MIEDLNMDITLKIMPTIREEDNLAMSSRNKYLTKSERKDAAFLYKALALAEELIHSGEKDPKKVIKKMRLLMQKSASVRIDYISIVEKNYLKEVSVLRGEVLIALAVFIGKTRLIDNIIVDAEKIRVGV